MKKIFNSLDSSLHFITLRMIAKVLINKHSIKMQLIFSDAQFWEIFFRLLIPNLSQNLEQEFLRFLNVGKNF